MTNFQGCLVCAPPLVAFFAVAGTALLACIFGYLLGAEKKREVVEERDQLKLKCAQLQEWIDGVDKVPMDMMNGGGHLYVLMGSGEIYRRMCDEKGNFEGEWEEVTGPWKTTGAT